MTKKQIKNQFLMKRIIEFTDFFSSEHVRCHIHRFIRKNNINSVADFMNIPKARTEKQRYNRNYAYMGLKTYQKIGEIQKIIEE